VECFHYTTKYPIRQEDFCVFCHEKKHYLQENAFFSCKYSQKEQKIGKMHNGLGKKEKNRPLIVNGLFFTFVRSAP